MKPKHTITSACVILALSGAGAHGATLVQTQAFSLQSGNLNLFFSGFDTSLGVLQSVYVELAYTRSGGYLAADNEGEPGTVNLTHVSNFTVDEQWAVLDWSRLSGGAQLLAAFLNRSVTTHSSAIGADDDPHTTDFNSSGPDYYRYDLPTVAHSSAGYFSNVSQFENKGAFAVPVGVSQSVDITSDGAVNKAYAPANLAGAMTITYTYEAVPEVSVMGLGAFALGGLLLRRRTQADSA